MSAVKFPSSMLYTPLQRMVKHFLYWGIFLQYRNWPFLVGAADRLPESTQCPLRSYPKEAENRSSRGLSSSQVIWKKTFKTSICTITRFSKGRTEGMLPRTEYSITFFLVPLLTSLGISFPVLCIQSKLWTAIDVCACVCIPRQASCRHHSF